MESLSSQANYEIDGKKYKQILRNNRKKLLRSVDPSDTLIDSIDDIFHGKLDGIKSYPTTTVKALKILKVPIGENPDTIKSFICALKDNNHKHVADVFMTNSAEHLMSDEHHELLTKKWTDLCKYLDPESGILDQLISRKVFSLSDKETVDAVKTWNDKVGKIVEILSRKTNSDFDQFIESLRAVGQEHVACVLTGDGSLPIKDATLKRLAKNRKKNYRKHGFRIYSVTHNAGNYGCFHED